MSKVIFLIGFMGAGKSTVGPLVASKLQKTFFDSDLELEKHLQYSIADIFEREGEHAFRRYETETLIRLNQTPHSVIAVGGGAPTVESNWEFFQRGITIYLNVPTQTLITRLEGAQRPLLDGLSVQDKQAKIESLIKSRQPFYQRADLIINADQPPQNVADAIAEQVTQCNL
jgi:shikimate kinase